MVQAAPTSKSAAPVRNAGTDVAMPAKSLSTNTASITAPAKVPTKEPEDNFSLPAFGPMTKTQDKLWIRGSLRESSVLWVIQANDQGASVKKVKKALYITWQFPPRSAKRAETHEECAKICLSLHLQGFFAGTNVAVASDFKSCPGCNTGTSKLIPAGIKLATSTVLAFVHPDFGVDIKGYVRLQKPKAIVKAKTTIQPKQAFRSGLDRFLDKQFLGMTFVEVKLASGTYKPEPLSQSCIFSHASLAPYIKVATTN
ncbi:hypothetical protein J1614_007026 [Plenodomus biglobosus]|nr:hypothetical protein J1614_007026 [Plenodomus biglobosus]